MQLSRLNHLAVSNNIKLQTKDIDIVSFNMRFIEMMKLFMYRHKLEWFSQEKSNGWKKKLFWTHFF